MRRDEIVLLDISKDVPIVLEKITSLLPGQELPRIGRDYEQRLLHGRQVKFGHLMECGAFAFLLPNIASPQEKGVAS
jgi:hypothetical protein